MNTPMKSLYGLALAAFCIGCARAEPPKPLLWKVSDADNEVYLLGSFHALKSSDYPWAASVEAAFVDAETLAFEIAPAEMNSPELAMKMLHAASWGSGQTLKQTLSPSAWRQLETYANKRGLPMATFETMEPWFVSLLIAMTEMQSSGYDSKQGLDRVLMARAEKAGKPARGLETSEEQIAALNGMSAAEQQQALAEALEESTDFKAELDRLHAQWRAGDDAGLFRSMGAELRDKYPQLYRRINVDRNQAWLPKIRAMLDGEKNQDTLVVVGSLHLLGDDGLVAQLRAKGYVVERL
jgi:uncharacterized protein YbaP (TraB family)